MLTEARPFAQALANLQSLSSTVLLPVILPWIKTNETIRFILLDHPSANNITLVPCAIA